MVQAHPFDQLLRRGLILRARLDSTILDDPNLTFHHKYIVILNHFCPDERMYFVMATSNLSKFQQIPHLGREVVTLAETDYPFLNKPTVLDFTDVQCLPLEELRRMVDKKLVTAVGTLKDQDLARCDEVIRGSKQIEPRVLPLILPGDYK